MEGQKEAAGRKRRMRDGKKGRKWGRKKDRKIRRKDGGGGEGGLNVFWGSRVLDFIVITKRWFWTRHSLKKCKNFSVHNAVL